MNILLTLFSLVFALTALDSYRCDSFAIPGKGTFRLGIQLQENVSSRMNMLIAGGRLASTRIELKDPLGKTARSFVNENRIGLVFMPQVTGDYFLEVENNSSEEVNFSLDLPVNSEGPFADKLEPNKVKELDEMLRSIIEAQKNLLVRQNTHLQMAKNTKGWIRKLTILEIVLCLFALYYVHGEAVKTFYSTRKV
ncbi:hypothetical protein NEHOM01_1682 [Nematocida homosporus]|uniref:uncharacterized protein n=1 Tax=Nematocida homosporus TaxID=1912981 RepID=UPI002220A3A8|nr:uncharacterized protein NEHOM01_1682 [Nematocida homosporus]KAI5186751.1 hypothetical protein NEHOM01_1682 [Nematocida homosporus]